MGLGHSPRIVTENLVLLLDAANPKNYNLTEVEVLVVAGGGGGSSGSGGGGGAGGLIYNSNFAVTPGTQLTVTVGNGGAGGGSYPAGGYSASTPGGDSIFGSLTAAGGGNGGGQNDNATNGGSGGGGGGGTNQPTQQVAGTGTAGQGNVGAAGIFNTRGGGGGGSGSAGSVVTGGSSTNISISGTSTTYAGGGGAGTYSLTAGNGGGGGAGNGTQGISVRGGDALVNTGSGGGGGGGEGSPLFRTAGGGAGGSGIIIVRYPGPQKAIGGTVTSVNGDTIHTFTTSGNFTPLVATNGSAVLGLSDLSGNRNFGTTAGSPTYNSANGGSLVFEGSDEYVSFTSNCYNIPLNNTITELTIDAWIYWNSFPIDNIDEIVSWWETGSQTYSDGFLGVTCSANGGGTNTNPMIRFGDGWANTGASFTASTDVNKWWNITAVKTADNAYIYKNSTLSATKGSALSWGFNNVLNIGRQHGAGEHINARISNIKLYNRALTAAEISQNFNALRGRYGL